MCLLNINLNRPFHIVSHNLIVLLGRLILFPGSKCMWNVDPFQIRFQIYEVALDGADIISTYETEDVAMRVGARPQ